MTPDIATTTYGLVVDGIGPVEITVNDRGQGQPLLLLHGGAGPQSVSGFADLLAETGQFRVIAPTLPGFGGTPRPDMLTSVVGLAAVLVELLRQLEVHNVMVVGNSIGGWITAEMALIGSPRISRIVLVSATGIEVEDHPIADFFSLTMDQVFELSYHDPAAYRIDLSAMPATQQQVMAGNRAALSVYAGSSMSDPTLRQRLAAVEVPTLVLWGDSDQIVDPDYGRAFADAIPGARYLLLSDTGHVPQLETPHQLLVPIVEFARAPATNGEER
ncbi:MAG: alpha/beta fold hydrolase [Acidimicrobiales bacterium]